MSSIKRWQQIWIAAVGFLAVVDVIVVVAVTLGRCLSWRMTHQLIWPFHQKPLSRDRPFIIQNSYSFILISFMFIQFHLAGSFLLLLFVFTLASAPCGRIPVIRIGGLWPRRAPFCFHAALPRCLKVDRRFIILVQLAGIISILLGNIFLWWFNVAMSQAQFEQGWLQFLGIHLHNFRGFIWTLEHYWRNVAKLQ